MMPARMERHARGKTAYHAGLAAESIVERDYARRGRPVMQRRWRGTAGEIDLIAAEGDALVFIEVKKSRSHARAAERVTPRQMARIMSSAEEFLGTQPRGQLTDVRFDLALVDDLGRVKVIENAFMH